jgi:hypothetical protein
VLDLHPLITRLVSEIVELLRHATVEELSELRSSAKPLATPRRPRARRTRPALRSVANTVRATAPEPVASAEITDPESLLAAVAPEAPTAADASLTAGDEAPPPSSEQPSVRRIVVLRPGETVAHASERGGVVIRRKRA